MNFSPLGDCAILITLGNSIDEATHKRVRAVTARLDAHPPRGIIDRVPAFASVVVHYEPLFVAGTEDRSPYDRMVAALSELLSEMRDDTLPEPPTVDIPVCYGGELGPDLEDVAARHGMTAAQVVELHASGKYRVYMVGFMPGFAYLGGLPERLATPRRQTPRTAVPAGTVGIGGRQTGVYPLVSPGGWNLIGRTPLRMFDANREEPTLLATGDRVRFRPISAAEFRDWNE
jgi:inhibitor of KinA